MKVRNLIPSAKIADYAERILVIEHNRIITDFNLPLYANGVPTLLFISQKGKINGKGANYLTLFGQTVVPETLTLTENFTLIAYFLKPYSLLPLFAVKAQELTDNPIDLNLVSSAKTIELQEQLLHSGSIQEMIDLLDNFILRLITNAKLDSTIIKYATTKIAANPSKEILLSVQKDLGMSERTFQRNFETKIGVAPNQYRRICQFNSAFQQLLKGDYYKLSDLAFQNGYADQSHYIRTFKEFTNITPKEFINYGS
jgi:AraC-like DNA-binding protein